MYTELSHNEKKVKYNTIEMNNDYRIYIGEIYDVEQEENHSRNMSDDL